MTSTQSSYDWAKQIKPDLKNLDSIPLTGSPPFPWEEFSAKLSQALECEKLTIKPDEMAWRTKDNLYEGLGDHLFPLIFCIPPLKGQVCWVMPAQEVDILATLLLTKETHPLNLHDQDLSESFYRFLALEVLYHFTQISYDKTLLPILTHQNPLPNQDSLCWDISLGVRNQTIWGRLIISPEFRRSWVEHFSQSQQVSSLSQELAQQVNVIAHVEAGKAYLSLADWKKVQLGDFILLDTYSLDPKRLEGRVMLTVNGKPTYRAKLKNHTLKILELPLLHEVDNPMAKQPKDEDEDDLDDLELTDEDHNLETEDEDFFDETDVESESESEMETEFESEEEATTTESEAETDEDLDFFTETEEETSQDTTTEQEPAPQGTKSKPISPEEIPITLTVEIGQVQMTMDQLLKLEPGNLLEIDIHPENGVDLTINGKIVGKGELIRIGDVLGVRVLQLGRKS